MKGKDEKHPIDGLFARKLRNASVPPAADGFACLQTRMGKSERSGFLAVWQNPAMVRYAAVAACLLLVSVLGWQFWKVGEPKTSDAVTVAVNETVHSSIKAVHKAEKADLNATNAPNTTNAYKENAPELAQTASASPEKELPLNDGRNGQLIKPVQNSIDSRRSAKNILPVESNNEVIAQRQPKVLEIKPATAPIEENPMPSEPSATPQTAIVQATSKPEKMPERVLVVTIAEPPALVAARQAAANARPQSAEKELAAQTEKTAGDTKPANIWQQLRRVREGDVFASRHDKEDADRGLFERAYRGVKHSIETNKAQKNE